MSTPSSSITYRHFETSDLKDALRLLQQLNPELEPEALEQRFSSILRDHPHYNCLLVFDGGNLVGLTGYWIATRIWCGRYLEIDNLVIDKEFRGRGIGAALLRQVEQIAHKKGCQVVTLDAYTTNRASHRFYHNMNYEIFGFHFVRTL